MTVRYGITVIGLCLMIDHIHCLIFSDTKDILKRFISNVTLQFVKEYNAVYGRRGQLFDRFGSAPKKGLKMLRTSIAYLYNNPVEKRLCRYAQDYRWNFLAYGCPDLRRKAIRDYPISLRRAVKEVDYAASKGYHLRYAMLYRLMDGLTKNEKKELTDYIIWRYSVIRYDILSDCYGGWNNLLVAVNSNAGSEYDISEAKGACSDLEYRELYRCARECGFRRVGEVISLPDADKVRLADFMLKSTSASRYQICRFLHLDGF